MQAPEPTKRHIIVTRRLVKYLSGTSSQALFFPQNDGVDSEPIVAFFDSDWLSGHTEIDDRNNGNRKQMPGVLEIEESVHRIIQLGGSGIHLRITLFKEHFVSEKDVLRNGYKCAVRRMQNPITTKNIFTGHKSAIFLTTNAQIFQHGSERQKST